MPNKSLGQHWLQDRQVLSLIAEEAAITEQDTILEIGPGLGTLTSELLKRAKAVIAVEYDSELARKLPGQFPGKNLTVIHQDILQFDLNQLPKGYKVVANVPYYITSSIVEKLMTAPNRPSLTVLLVQKEVACRLAAKPGDMSVLAVATQVFADVSLSEVVRRELFFPEPKVDSQVVILKTLKQPRVEAEDQKRFFRIVKAGFREKRKKLRNSIAAGLAISTPEAEKLLERTGIDANNRAQDLSIEEWLRLTKNSV